MKKILNTNAGVVGVTTATGQVSGMADYAIVNTTDAELFDMVWGDAAYNPFGNLFDTVSNDAGSVVTRTNPTTFIRKTELSSLTVPAGAWTKIQSDPELLDGWADNNATPIAGAPAAADKLYAYSKWVNKLDTTAGTVNVINNTTTISLPYMVSTSIASNATMAKTLMVKGTDLGDWVINVGPKNGAPVTTTAAILRHTVINDVERMIVFDVVVPVALVNSPFTVSLRFGAVASLDFLFDNQAALTALPAKVLTLRLATNIKGVDYVDTDVTPVTGIVAASGYAKPTVTATTNTGQDLKFTLSRPGKVSLRTTSWGIDDVVSTGNDVTIPVPVGKPVSNTYQLYVTTSDNVTWPPITVEYTAT